jgi:hypothetical protein
MSFLAVTDYTGKPALINLNYVTTLAYDHIVGSTEPKRIRLWAGQQSILCHEKEDIYEIMKSIDSAIGVHKTKMVDVLIDEQKRLTT